MTALGQDRQGNCPGPQTTRATSKIFKLIQSLSLAKGYLFRRLASVSVFVLFAYILCNYTCFSYFKICNCTT